VSPAPNWAVVPGQRSTGNNSRDWSCHGLALKSNVLNCGNALVWAWGHVPELRAKYPGTEDVSQPTPSAHRRRPGPSTGCIPRATSTPADNPGTSRSREPPSLTTSPPGQASPCYKKCEISPPSDPTFVLLRLETSGLLSSWASDEYAISEGSAVGRPAVGAWSHRLSARRAASRDRFSHSSTPAVVS
jgi:hypothetical protein